MRAETARFISSAPNLESAFAALGLVNPPITAKFHTEQWISESIASGVRCQDDAHTIASRNGDQQLCYDFDSDQMRVDLLSATLGASSSVDPNGGALRPPSSVQTENPVTPQASVLASMPIQDKKRQREDDEEAPYAEAFMTTMAESETQEDRNMKKWMAKKTKVAEPSDDEATVDLPEATDIGALDDDESLEFDLLDDSALDTDDLLPDDLFSYYDVASPSTPPPTANGVL